MKTSRKSNEWTSSQLEAAEKTAKALVKIYVLNHVNMPTADLQNLARAYLDLLKDQKMIDECLLKSHLWLERAMG